jgi:hypothetical protein
MAIEMDSMHFPLVELSLELPIARPKFKTLHFVSTLAVFENLH